MIYIRGYKDLRKISAFYNLKETCILLFEVHLDKIALIQKFIYKDFTIGEFIKFLKHFNNYNTEKLLNSHLFMSSISSLNNVKVVEIPEQSTFNTHLEEMYISVKDRIEEPYEDISIKSESEINCLKQIFIEYGEVLFK